ncbi:hypothetical protein Tco_0822371 [Tanacetum coccineum]|uniref:Uncharacterized protein n=1 Tax=Tanacetum coccineum TaxID=301880 RepID=A0ABQ5AHI1_9ASTR
MLHHTLIITLLTALLKVVFGWTSEGQALLSIKCLTGFLLMCFVESTCIMTAFFRKLIIMPLSVISISSDSFEESVGSSTSRVILFGMILSVIPFDVSTIITDVPEVATAVVALLAGVLDLDTHSTSETDSFEDPSSLVHALVAPVTSPFLFTDSCEPSRDFSNSDSFERPISPELHEVAVARWRSKVEACSSSSFTPPAPCQTVPALPDLPCRSAILRRRVSPCSSSSATHSSSSVSAGPSRKRCRSPTADSQLIRADLLPSCKRLRDPSSAYYQEVSIKVSTKLNIEDSIKTRTEGDIDRDIEDSYEVDTELDIDSDYLEDIEADIAAEAASAIKADTMVDAVAAVEAGSERVEAEADAKPSARDTIEIAVDVVVEPVVPDDLPVSTVGDRLDEIKELVQGMYEHLLAIPAQRLDDIEEE